MRSPQYPAPSAQHPAFSAHHPVLSTQYSVLIGQCSVLITQCAALITEYSGFSSQCSAPSTQHPALSAEDSVLSTQHTVLSTAIDSRCFMGVLPGMVVPHPGIKVFWQAPTQPRHKVVRGEGSWATSAPGCTCAVSCPRIMIKACWG